MTIRNILWSDLVPSPRNVRKVKVGVETLAANIAADGLIQNLAGVTREDGKFEVQAGERRRRAIVHLVKTGVWPRDTVVPCKDVAGGDAVSISYAENAQRVAMHPADAIRAFAALADEGHDEAAIAHRYGYDPREVRKMLALAAVSPKVVNALAADKIDLATAQAFTLTDDHKRQERVLRRARSAHEVRSLLTESKVTTGHRLFRFVGADAYAAAGGTITGDLFAKDGEGYANDPALVQQLADDKLDAIEAEARAEGWGEVITAEQTPYDSYRWHRLYPDAERLILTDDEAVRMDTLIAARDVRMAELSDADEAEDDPVLIGIEDEMEGLGSVERSYAPGTMARGLLLVMPDHDGGVSRTAYSRKPFGLAGSTSKAPAGPRPLYDARITHDLSCIRTAAIQREVARNEQVALAVLLDRLLPIVMDGLAGSHAVQLRGDAVEPAIDALLTTSAISTPFDHVVPLLAGLPEDEAERFAWLLDLSHESVVALLAACTAALVDARDGRFDPQRVRSADRIARAVGLNMHDHWEGGIEFFSRLTKKAMLAALEETCGTEAADNCRKLGKQDLAAVCAERIPGRGWPPPALVTPEVAEVEPFDAANDEEPLMEAAE